MPWKKQKAGNSKLEEVEFLQGRINPFYPIDPLTTYVINILDSLQAADSFRRKFDEVVKNSHWYFLFCAK